MVRFFNDYYRKQYVDGINKIMEENFFPCDEAIFYFRNKCLLFMENYNSFDNFTKESMDTLNIIMLLDALKMIIYHQKVGIASIKDYIMYDTIINMLNKIDDLLADETEEDQLIVSIDDMYEESDKILYILNQAFIFADLDLIQKIKIFNSFTDEEHELLSLHNDFHTQDKINYDYKKINIDTLKKYVLFKENRLLEINFYIDNKIIVRELKDYILNLSNYKGNEGAILLLEIAKIEYSRLKYIFENNILKEEVKPYVLNRIRFYEKESLENIVNSLSNEMLEELLHNFINLYVHNEYYGTKFEVSEDFKVDCGKVYNKLKLK